MLTFQIQIILPNTIDSFLENTSRKLPPLFFAKVVDKQFS